MTWAYYYEVGHYEACISESEDPFALIEEAFSETPEHRHHSIRIGRMVSFSAADVVDADDVLELVRDRLYDRVDDSSAWADDSSAWADDGFAGALREALGHVTCDPERACEGGVYPLPIEYREGTWTFGGSGNVEPNEGDEPAAIIVYTVEPSPETGDVGWCWWALGDMGVAPTLREAMARAEERIRREL